MSYILDALKKAESERRLGSVPDLHIQTSAPANPDRRLPRKLALAAGVAILGAGLALAWWLKGSTPAEPVTAPMPPFPIADEPKAPEIVALGPAIKAEETEIEPPKSIEPEKPRASRRAASERDSEKPRERIQRKPSEPAARKVDATPSLRAPAPGEIPPLAIGGYIYSENPRERQLLANKRLLHEGEEAAPGLVLEQMLPKAAVFSYQGKRYQVAY
jgi:general secretion pathway protein B